MSVPPSSKAQKALVLEEVVGLINRYGLTRQDVLWSGRAMDQHQFNRLKARNWSEFSLDRAYLIRDSAWAAVGISIAA